MSYQTYTTRALVCGSKASNTSDKSLLLFTREAGMLWGSVRSVREERSRQRYALQDFSEARISLVKGKAGWRVGSATSLCNFYKNAPAREHRGAVVHITKLLRQFIQGEETVTQIYDDTLAALEALVATPPEAAVHIVDLYTYRLLHRLGYIAPESELTPLTDENVWSTPVKELPGKAQIAITRAVHASHL